MKIAVVGAGASGLMVAGLLRGKGHDVTVFDGNEKAGKKIYITGKGRCNLTNLCEPADFLAHVVRGGKFLHSAIYRFTSENAVDFFENLGLKTKLERGNRVFPVSDKASDVTKVLEKVHCRGVRFCFNRKVEKIEKAEQNFKIYTKKTEAHFENTDFGEGKFFNEGKSGESEVFDCVVIATGGKSYSKTGSDGSGYRLARDFGHTIVPIVPALCPIKVRGEYIKKLQGVSLKNVRLCAAVDGKKLSWQGEMMFTDEGITGPIVLTASSHINRAEKVALSIDFKPALTEEQLSDRLLREFDTAKNKALSSVLNNLLPKSVADVFGEVIGLDKQKKNNSITKEERMKIVRNLKNFPLEFDGLYPLETAVVTSGGVTTDEVNPKTFESKLVPGLYFVGEVLDCDALTGGFNLQIAWATAQSMAREFEG